MARLLGLDYGEKRIGVAMSDPTGFLASSVCILDATRADVMGDLVRLCREHDVSGVVVGLPLNMDGSAGPQAEVLPPRGNAD